MKHLFLVHSPITYLASVSVINELDIPAKDAVIIFFEFDKVINNNQYTSISISDFFSKRSAIKKLYNYFRYFNIIERIDLIVNSVINDDGFIAYVPVLIFVGKALVTHSKCRNFNFIEEGLVNYYKEETLKSIAAVNSKDSWRSSILKDPKRVLTEIYLLLRGYNFKLQALPFPYSCYSSFPEVKFFGLNANAFPLADKSKTYITPFNYTTFEAIGQKLNVDLSNKFIWIGDGGITHHGFSENNYIEGIKKGCISFLKQKNETAIYIKFHRDEPVHLRQAVNKLFSDNNIIAEVIADSAIMELLLFKAKNVTLIGVYSSLLFYAGVMGHHSFSIYNFLKSEYSKAIANRDFNFYWDKVKLIPESNLVNA